MATFPSGLRVAFEVEYKPFSPEAWKQKDVEYAAEGVARVWLFGHLRRHLAQPRKEVHWPEGVPDDRLVLRDLTRAVALAGQPLVFVNPIEQVVATAVTEGRHVPEGDDERHEVWWERSHRFGLRLPDGEPVWGETLKVRLDALGDCELLPDGRFVTPTMRDVERDRERIESLAQAAKERYGAKIAAQRRAEEAAEAMRQWKLDNRDRIAEYARQQQAAAAAAWEQHPLRAEIVKHYGDVPAFLAAELQWDRGVFADPAHWHCQLFSDLCSSSNIGKSFTMPQVYGMLAKQFRFHSNTEKRGNAISRFLLLLKNMGYLAFRDEDGYIEGNVSVLGNLARPPAKPPTPPLPEPQAARVRTPRPPAPVRVPRVYAEAPSRTTDRRAPRPSVNPWRYETLPDYHGGFGLLVHHLGPLVNPPGWYLDAFKAIRDSAEIPDLAALRAVADLDARRVADVDLAEFAERVRVALGR